MLGANPRVLAFYVMTIITTAYLAMLTFKFFSKSGVAIPSEFVGMHALLLTSYTGAVQGDRLNGEDNGYQRLPGEFMAFSWVLFLMGFTILNTVFQVGDRAVLADMWPMPITLIVGLLGVNYVFKNHPALVKGVGKKLASISTNGNGKNGDSGGADSPPATPTP